MRWIFVFRRDGAVIRWQIIKGKRAITSDTALRLAKYFGNSPEFWMNLQTMHDLSKTRMEHGKQIEEEVRVGKRIA